MRILAVSSSPRFRSAPTPPDPLPPVSTSAPAPSPPGRLTGRQLFEPLIRQSKIPGGMAVLRTALRATREWMSATPGVTTSQFLDRLNAELAAAQPRPSELHWRWAITRIWPKGRSLLQAGGPRAEAVARQYRAKQEQPIDVELLHAAPLSPLLKAQVKLGVPLPGVTPPGDRQLALDVDLIPVEPDKTDHRKMFGKGVKTRDYFRVVDTVRAHFQAHILPAVKERLQQVAQPSPGGLSLAQIREALTTPVAAATPQAAAQPPLTERSFGTLKVFGKPYQVSLNPHGIEWGGRSREI